MARNSEEIRELVKSGDADELTPEEARWAVDFNLVTPEEASRLGLKLVDREVEEEDQPYAGHVVSEKVDTLPPHPDDANEDKSLDDMSKAELEEQAELRDISKSGNKDELLARIVEHDEANPD